MEAVLTKTAKKGFVKMPLTAWNEKAERRSLIQSIIEDAPKNVPLTDDDIQEEINMVRYGNKFVCFGTR